MQLRELFNEFPIEDGGVVTLALQQLLREPLNVSHDWRRAEQILQQARDLMPERLEVPVALYKMYAYSNRFEEALAVIDEVLYQAAEEGGFVADWRQLDDDNTPWRQAAGARRFYLYSMKATGFVCLRKGDIAGACAVLEKLLRLDPLDQVGGSVVYDMAQLILDQEDEQGVA